MSAHIEGYEMKTLTLKNVSGNGRRKFVKEIIAAVKEGWDICDPFDEIEELPEGFNANHTTPLFAGNVRITLYREIGKVVESVDELKKEIADLKSEIEASKKKPTAKKTAAKATRKTTVSKTIKKEDK